MFYQMDINYNTILNSKLIESFWEIETVYLLLAGFYIFRASIFMITADKEATFPICQ